jgi:type IV pilus assembly protein PilB
VSALREQARTGVRLGQILVDHGLVEEVILYDALAKMTGLDRFNLRTVILERSALNIVNGDWAVDHGVVPFKVDVQARTLHVAVTDPTNLKPVDDLAFRLGLKIKLFVASETELERVVRHHFHGQALDRDPRSVRRPSAPQRHTAEIDDSTIMRGMDSMRDEVLKSEKHVWDDPSTPGIADEERALLSQLKPIFDAQEEGARALRAIFELCVARGIIRREEYLERLKRTPD